MLLGWGRKECVGKGPFLSHVTNTALSWLTTAGFVAHFSAIKLLVFPPHVVIFERDHMSLSVGSTCL